MGLLSDVIFKRSVSKGDIICWDDVTVPESLAVCAWKQILNRSLKNKKR